MGTQTTVTQGPPGPAVIKRGISRVTFDFITLCELQAKITRLDLATAMPLILGSLVMVGFAMIAGIAGMALVLGGIAFAIAESFALPLATAFAGVGLASVVMAFIIFKLGIGKIRRSSKAFDHTRDEFHRNVETVKASLAGEQFPFNE